MLCPNNGESAATIHRASSSDGVVAEKSLRSGGMEQGRAKPNPQAALVLLVRTYPDMLERLEKVAAA